jgi:hypothetical protein
MLRPYEGKINARAQSGVTVPQEKPKGKPKTQVQNRYLGHPAVQSGEGLEEAGADADGEMAQVDQG